MKVKRVLDGKVTDLVTNKEYELGGIEVKEGFGIIRVIRVPDGKGLCLTTYEFDQGKKTFIESAVYTEENGYGKIETSVEAELTDYIWEK